MFIAVSLSVDIKRLKNVMLGLQRFSYKKLCIKIINVRNKLVLIALEIKNLLKLF